MDSKKKRLESHHTYWNDIVNRDRTEKTNDTKWFAFPSIRRKNTKGTERETLTIGVIQFSFGQRNKLDWHEDGKESIKENSSSLLRDNKKKSERKEWLIRRRSNLFLNQRINLDQIERKTNGWYEKTFAYSFKSNRKSTMIRKDSECGRGGFILTLS